MWDNFLTHQSWHISLIKTNSIPVIHACRSLVILKFICNLQVTIICETWSYHNLIIWPAQAAQSNCLCETDPGKQYFLHCYFLQCYRLNHNFMFAMPFDNINSIRLLLLWYYAIDYCTLIWVITGSEETESCHFKFTTFDPVWASMLEARIFSISMMLDHRQRLREKLFVD